MIALSRLEHADTIAARIIKLMIDRDKMIADHKVETHRREAAMQFALAPIDGEINELTKSLEAYVSAHPDQYPSKRPAGDGKYGLRKYPESLELDKDFDADAESNRLGLVLSIDQPGKPDRDAITDALHAGVKVCGAAIRDARYGLDIKPNKHKDKETV